jgi:DUF4097 and DUF4098 domain-containing protein YvlB
MTVPRHQGWAVSFELFVPFNSDLSLKAHGGGINVAGVRGRIDFETVNGGVSLRQLAGAVHGQTINGGVSIELSGDRWDSEGIDVKTTNGGVNLVLPENYSARLEASTVHGGFKVDVPVTMPSGRIRTKSGRGCRLRRLSPSRHHNQRRCDRQTQGVTIQPQRARFLCFFVANACICSSH